jgi:hypothetical protein
MGVSAMTQANSRFRRLAVRALVLSAITLAAVSVFPQNAPAAPATPTALAAPAAQVNAPTDRQVRAAILRAIDGLRKLQDPSGRWPTHAQEGGVTALATYTLLAAGVAPDDRAMETALQSLRRVENENTYVVALKAMAFSAADPEKYRDEIQACADSLVLFQTAVGGWGYGRCTPTPLSQNLDFGLPSVKMEADRQRVCGRPDGSNTQFAILGLSEAERAGARVPPDVWQKAARFLRTTQLPDGGWGYVANAQIAAPAKGDGAGSGTGKDAEPGVSYGSMTAVSVASLVLCHDRLARTDTPETGGERLAAIDKGLAWLAKNYTLDENPGRALAWYYFWIYGLERVGVATGRRTLGGHDWFREGTAMLVNGQRPDGSWTGRIYYDAFGLLFLAKGRRPLLVERLEWDGPWRRDPRDLDRLTWYLEKRVGGDFVAWQTLRGDAPLEDWLAAPVVHVAGRGALKLSPAAAANLKAYIQQGGLALFDADGGDAAFTDSVRKAMAAMFPESKFEPLAADHPIYSATHKISPGASDAVIGPATKGLAIAAAAAPMADKSAPVQLEVLNVGCRAAVLLAPKGLADGWAAADPAKPNDALRLGENLAVYATTGETLPERLAVATPLALPPETPTPRGASRIGQVQHDGDWQPRPYALPSLLGEVAKRFGVAVANRPEPVRLTQAGLAGYNVLYITGHYALTLSDAERAALKEYLDRGGFLWAEACCGRPAFDKAFRELIKGMYPDTELEKLPVEHPIFQGKVGAAISEVAYSPAVQAESPALHQPVLYGLTRSGHLVIVYSPYGLACGLDGMKTYGARTYSPGDAKRLAINILLFGLAF